MSSRPVIEVHIEDTIFICDHTPFDHDIPHRSDDPPIDHEGYNTFRDQNIARISEIADYLQENLDPIRLFFFMTYTYVYWHTWRPAMLTLPNHLILQLAHNLVPFIVENWEELVVPHYRLC